MARTKQVDLVEQEALRIGYGILLQRVLKTLEIDGPLKAVMTSQKLDLEKRLKEVGE